MPRTGNEGSKARSTRSSSLRGKCIPSSMFQKVAGSLGNPQLEVCSKVIYSVAAGEESDVWYYKDLLVTVL